MTVNNTNTSNATDAGIRFNEPLELVMYVRTMSCPFVSVARRVLNEDNVPYREVFIDVDKDAEQRVVNWTGFMSVPTLVAARLGEDLPLAPPLPLVPGSSPRGIDRGAMITEPDDDQLRDWLRQIGLLPHLPA
jgi:glutaredoxin